MLNFGQMDGQMVRQTMDGCTNKQTNIRRKISDPEQTLNAIIAGKDAYFQYIVLILTCMYHCLSFYFVMK